MAKDPYKYFRIEARELIEGLTRGVLDLEKGESTSATIGVLLRLTHTIKGAARVVKEAGISEIAHAMEEVLAPFRTSHEKVPNNVVSELLKYLDAISARLAALDLGGDSVADKRESAQVPKTQHAEDRLETVRVDIGEMDRLLERLAEAASQLAAVRRDAHSVHHATQLSGMIFDKLSRQTSLNAGRTELATASILPSAEELYRWLGLLKENLTTGVERLDSELSQIRDAANQLRLLPASMIFAPLERAVRDAAQSLNKSVKFEACGGETRLDAHVLAALRDALLHVVRNAVAHGIESETKRKQSGKPANGTVTLSIERRGNRVAFICRDDGLGIDVVAIRNAAIQRGLISADNADTVGLQEIVQLILRGGVTTTESVNEVSGRGIGLDAVRSTASRLKGTVSIHTERGRETTVDICVPISLSSLAALRVEAGGMIVSIPLDCVTKTMRITESDLVTTSDSISILCDGCSIPFVSLSRLLGKPVNSKGLRKLRSVVIVTFEQNIVAIGVENLLGTVTILLRSLPPFIHAEEFIAGASLDNNGNPELVLDPAGIVAAANKLRSVEITSSISTASRPSILVVDDSLTTRMLEQSILESAGYHVELAVSAEDAIERIRERKHGVYIVDVEMPGMDGFGFVEYVKADPLLRETPCILVTSRNAPEDKARGKKAGAHAYIVKSEFNQDFLLKTIRDLMG